MLSPGETVLTPSQLKGLGGSVNNTSITVNMGAGETVQTDVEAEAIRRNKWHILQMEQTILQQIRA